MNEIVFAETSVALLYHEMSALYAVLLHCELFPDKPLSAEMQGAATHLLKKIRPSLDEAFTARETS